MIRYATAQRAKEMWGQGLSSRKIGRALGMSHATVLNIVNGTRFKHENTAHNYDGRRLANYSVESVFGQLVPGVTKRQADVLRYILECYQDGFIPTKQEINAEIRCDCRKPIKALREAEYLAPRIRSGPARNRIQLSQKALELLNANSNLRNGEACSER